MENAKALYEALERPLNRIGYSQRPKQLHSDADLHAGFRPGLLVPSIERIVFPHYPIHMCLRTLMSLRHRPT